MLYAEVLCRQHTVVMLMTLHCAWAKKRDWKPKLQAYVQISDQVPHSVCAWALCLCESHTLISIISAASQVTICAVNPTLFFFGRI